MSDFEKVKGSEWLSRCAALHDGGHTWFGALTAIDDVRGGSLDVVLMVARPTESHTTNFRTSLPREIPILDSVGHLWSGALFAERECHEMFGVQFTSHPDLRPLLLPPGLAAPPLRADVGLGRRATTSWPGEGEPGDKPGVRRRRNRPLGSDADEWAVTL